MLYGCVIKPDEWEKIDRLGFDFIEMSCKEVVNCSIDRYRVLLSVAKNAETPLTNMNAYCPPSLTIVGENYSGAEVKSYAERCAERAIRLGVKSIGIGSPASRRVPTTFSTSLITSQLLDFFSITSEVFGKYGITVCVEQLGPQYCNTINTLDEAKRIIDELGLSNLKLLIDFYQLEYSEEADIYMGNLIPLIGHVHFSDDEGDLYKRSYLKISREAIHKKRVEDLRYWGYSGTISIEVDVDFDPVLAMRSLQILKGENKWLQNAER